MAAGTSKTDATTGIPGAIFETWKADADAQVILTGNGGNNLGVSGSPMRLKVGSLIDAIGNTVDTYLGGYVIGTTAIQGTDPVLVNGLTTAVALAGTLVLSIRDADATHKGAVTTSAQTFAGSKSFADYIRPADGRGVWGDGDVYWITNSGKVTQWYPDGLNCRLALFSNGSFSVGEAINAGGPCLVLANNTPIEALKADRSAAVVIFKMTTGDVLESGSASYPMKLLFTTLQADLGSDATGDLLYRASTSNLARLGIGSTGQALVVTSGLPSWHTLTAADVGADASGAAASALSSALAADVALTNSAPANVTKASAAAGSASTSARADHKHDVTTAVAGSATPGDSAAEGTATSLARSDHKHALPGYGTGAATICQGNDSRLSDDRTASGLRTASTVVVISSATAPTANQVLYSSSSTAAAWHSLAAADVGAAASSLTVTGTAPVTVNGDNSAHALTGNLTVAVDAASGTSDGIVTTGTQTIAGIKTFSSYIVTPSISAGGFSIYALPVTGGADTFVLANASQVLNSKTIGTSWKTALGSDATGDLYYRDSGGFLQRLPIGTTNQKLTVVGGVPAWA